jgi:hypothetical protein
MCNTAVYIGVRWGVHTLTGRHLSRYNFTTDIKFSKLNNKLQLVQHIPIDTPVWSLPCLGVSHILH